jgi:hypothetical protein
MARRAGGVGNARRSELALSVWFVGQRREECDGLDGRDEGLVYLAFLFVWFISQREPEKPNEPHEQDRRAIR